MKLRVDADELASCVSCGLCLPHCPTFRVTGEEARSPRGRIAAMRAVDEGEAAADAEFVAAMATCVQCRGCETACPSGVPFGRLMAGTRETLADAPAPAPGRQPWWRRWGYASLGRHRLVLAGSTALAVAQRTGLVPSRRLGLPERLPLRRVPLVPSGADVHLFTGCVMDAWQRPVHLAAQRLAEATGAGVGLLGDGAACCGALAEHAGLGDHARTLARRVIDAVPPTGDVLVDSAGCGAALKEYGTLLGTPEAAAFSARVHDIDEWLAARLDRLPPARRRIGGVVAVQDPCHLRHAQRAHEAVRVLLAPYVDELVELDDEGMCCGAGGAYAVLEPDLAGAIRDRKVRAIERSGATVVASANPGCMLHLAAVGVAVRHPVELVAEAIGLG